MSRDLAARTARGGQAAIASPSPKWSAVVATLESRGMTRADIARHARVHRSTITRLATGERAQPSYPVGATLMFLSTREDD